MSESLRKLMLDHANGKITLREALEAAFDLGWDANGG